MCGITGAVDLRGRREFPLERLAAMTAAIAHRGPDDDQFHREPGVALGVRRLAIIDVAGGRQPMSNETEDVWVAQEGELYDFRQLRQDLLGRGHRLHSHCDTEVWPHLYEEQGERVIENARGQFGVSLWDRKRRTLLLGRDRAGIAPLFYAEVDGWLIWGSEIKALLASGMIDPAPDPLGLDYFFNTFVLSNSRTCFAGIQSLPPGHLLRVADGDVTLRQYWDLDFPDHGSEQRFARVDDAIDEYERLLRDSVRLRLASEPPVCSYLSGGLDSTTILGLCAQENGSPLPAFTIGLEKSGPRDERTQAQESAQVVGSPLNTVSMTSRDIAEAFPELIQAAEGPVMDTSAACTLRLARAVRDHGYVVSLSGEGADESLAGYVWFKIDKAFRPGTKLVNDAVRQFVFRRLVGRGRTPIPFRGIAGVRPAQQVTFEMMAHSRHWLYSPQMWDRVAGYDAFDEMGFDSDRLKRWHPLNRSLYVANKIMLPGMLLAAKGDRAMHNSSTEGRFPFLDERLIEFSAGLHPSYKLRGFRDKWLLRQVARKVLPAQIAGRRKTMFRANLARTFFTPDRPEWVDELLSERSLLATGYFNPQDVERARRAVLGSSRASFRRFVLEMGLTGVVSTQLWHHTFCGGGLADLPTWSPPNVAAQAAHSGNGNGAGLVLPSPRTPSAKAVARRT